MSDYSIKKSVRQCFNKPGAVSLKKDLFEKIANSGITSSTKAALRQLNYPCVPNVVAAFKAIRKKGVDFRCGKGRFGLGEYVKKFRPPKTHFQGVQRLRCQKYIAVTGSGKSHSNLYIIEMRSRPVSGPFGSNLTSRKKNPPDSDKIIKEFRIDSDLKHAGGFQQVGNYLAIGIEEGETSQIVFLDVSKPETPESIDRLDRSGLPKLHDTKPSAGAVAILKESDGKYLLIVGRGNSNVLDFYRSKRDRLEFKGSKPFASWHEDELKKGKGMDDEFGNYQNINLLQQCDGKLFLVGLHRNQALGGRDYADLFRINFKDDGHPVITKIANKHLVCKGCNMDAGGGVFVDSSGKLYLYGVQHWLEDKRLRFNEFT